MPSTSRPQSAALRLSTLLLAAALPLLLAGCASQVTLPALPDCHPANAAAATAPLAAPSGLLDPSAPIPAAEPDLLEDHGAADHDHAPPAGGGSMAEPTGHEHHHPSADPAAETAPETPGMPGMHEMHGMHGGAGGEGHGGESAAPDAATVYACPMHPEVRSESPGTCPKCGMALEPVPSPETESADEEEHDHDHGSHR